MDAKDLIAALGMERHPEGGWFKETFRDSATIDGRAVSTAIYYLLEKGDRSHWHRVDATEVWHFHAGAPLELSMSSDGKWIEMLMLGADVPGGELPQIVVPKGHWQRRNRPATGRWSAVRCRPVSNFPASRWPAGWQPG